MLSSVPALVLDIQKGALKVVSSPTMELKEVLDLLDAHTIPHKTWGVGESLKTADVLLEEIRNGESQLAISNVGLVRLVRLASIDVFYQDEEGWLKHLIESKVTAEDGRTRERGYARSLSEKLHFNESPESGLARGLKEELGIETGFKILSKIPRIEMHQSKSFTGLITAAEIHPAIAVIKDDEYRPEGYVAKDGLRTLHFIWRDGRLN